MPQVVGQYCTSDDCINVAGLANLAAYSNLASNGATPSTPDYAQVQYYMNYAASQIARAFANYGGANYPAVFIGQDVYTIAFLCATIAVAEMYFGRGLRDEATDTKWKKKLDGAWEQIRQGREKERFQVARRWPDPTCAVGDMPCGI